jgi:hypothetical protein
MRLAIDVLDATANVARVRRAGEPEPDPHPHADQLVERLPRRDLEQRATGADIDDVRGERPIGEVHDSVVAPHQDLCPHRTPAIAEGNPYFS